MRKFSESHRSPSVLQQASTFLPDRLLSGVSTQVASPNLTAQVLRPGTRTPKLSFQCSAHLLLSPHMGE
jgi:hypothetical protein